MKTRFLAIFLGAALVSIFAGVELLHGQNKTIPWSSFNMGFNDAASTTHVIKSVIGQSFVDTSDQPSIHVNSGFLTDTLVQKLTFPATLSVFGAWNLLSLPVITTNSLKTALFPSAASSAFAYSGSYVTSDTLRRGVGYWLKFHSDGQVNFLGETVMRETLAVNSRWNMIGSISIPVAVADIQTIPPGLVVSNFFWYDPVDNYKIADSIMPGRGYWVKASQAGMIILGSSSNASSAGRIKILPDSELPPPPPDALLDKGLPREFSLSQNYPNPFNPTTTISYQLPIDSKVRIKIYNLLGQEIVTLVDKIEKAGRWSVYWSSNQADRSLGSGVYFYRIEAVGLNRVHKSFIEVKKMSLIK